MNPISRLTVIIVIGLAVLAGACGDDSSSVAGPGTPDTDGSGSGGTGATGGSDDAGGRGWLEGDDLAWFPEFDETEEFAAEAVSADGLSVAPTEADDDTAGDVARDVATLPPDVEPEPPLIDQDPLQAGSIDDGADYEAYRQYREGITGAGVPVRPLDVDDPTIIAVTGGNGLPVLDASVSVAAADQQGDSSDPTVVLRTTADGTTRFLPDAYGPADDQEASADTWDVTVTVGDTTTTASFERGEPRLEITVDAPGGIDGSVPVDVHFLLDATGSMGDEIDRLRTNMASVAAQIDALPSSPDVRFGMTVYRDEGDLFVTRTFDLTDDLSSFLDALDDVVADGGGDYPEALDEALADALQRPEWRRDGAVELIVLIADAPPQVERDVPTPYTSSALEALERGVKILPVAASGTDDQAEYVLRELAFVTGGRFVFLSYGVDGSGGTATGSGTDITPDDYDQLPLDQLVVRLVEDEILALTGGQPVPDETTTTTTLAPPTTTQ